MIRQADKNDIEQLAELFNAYRVFYNKASDISGAKDFLATRMQNNESVIYISEASDGKLTGFVQLYPLFSSTRMNKLWLLNDLFVHADFRGNGYSVALIEKAKELAKATNSAGLILETEKTNKIGNHLYPKTGFERDEDHNYYSWSVEYP